MDWARLTPGFLPSVARRLSFTMAAFLKTVRAAIRNRPGATTIIFRAPVADDELTAESDAPAAERHPLRITAFLILLSTNDFGTRRSTVQHRDLGKWCDPLRLLVLLLLAQRPLLFAHLVFEQLEFEREALFFDFRIERVGLAPVFAPLEPRRGEKAAYGKD